MRRKFGTCWVEYTYPIDFMDHSLIMKIALCWYQKRTNTKWTYDLMDHLMVDFFLKNIALDVMTYLVVLDAYELQLEDVKVFNDLIDEC